MEECCRTWVREVVGYGEVGGQVGSLGCPGASNSLEGSHFSSTSWECDVTFLSAGVPITTWDPHLTAQVKPPMASWLRSSEPQSRWKGAEGKILLFLLRRENSGLRARPGQHLPRGLVLIV